MTFTTTPSCISGHTTSHERRAPLHFSLGRLLAVATCAALFACGGDPSATEPSNIAQSQSALGSTVGLDDPLLFDAQYYSSRYPDLQTAFHGDVTALRSHWLTYGIGEGRRASPIFDCTTYLSIYQDLRVAFKTDCALAMQHFLTQGLPNEARRASIEFDVSNYLARYPDLVGAFGANGYLQAARHFMGFSGGGLWTEGRSGSNEFDVRYYLCHYSDLKQAFGTNFRAAAEHFASTGLPIEGRRGSTLFDIRNFLSRYPNYQTTFGTDFYRATNFWLAYGISGGLSGNPGDGGGANYCTVPVPALPTGTQYQQMGISSTSVTGQLTWASVSGATYYKVQSRPTTGTTINQTVSGTSTTVTLNLNTLYSHGVAACNASGCSDYAWITPITTPPSPPTGLKAVWQDQGTNQAMIVSWNAVGGAQNYSIQQKRLSDGATDNWITGLTATKKEFNWLRLSTSYVYSVIACGAIACSVPAYVTGTVGSGGTSGLINIDLQMSWSDATSCANSSSGFWVDGISYGQASGSPSSSGSGLTCDIQKLAAPLAIKKHWVCSQWTAYCCKCQTLTSTDYTPTTTLVGSDCGYDSPAVTTSNPCK
jgi:hypothetical protein